MNEVFIVESDRGRMVLRGHRQADRSAIEFEHAVMDTARAGGVPAPRALDTRDGDRIVRWDRRWWSLLIWIEGEQPERGSHTVEQSVAMGQMLARIHLVLEPMRPRSRQAPPLDDTAATIRKADELLSFIDQQPNGGDDETAAMRWLTGQRDWLASRPAEARPEPVHGRLVHGDYHDQNLVFNGSVVVGVFDWEKADVGDPAEELIRALHLSLRLDPLRCNAFINGYRSRKPMTADDLDRAAKNYGYRRDRSVWFFDELYRQGNERLRPLINHRPFTPFATSWKGVREHL